MHVLATFSRLGNIGSFIFSGSLNTACMCLFSCFLTVCIKKRLHYVSQGVLKLKIRSSCLSVWRLRLQTHSALLDLVSSLADGIQPLSQGALRSSLGSWLILGKAEALPWPREVNRQEETTAHSLEPFAEVLSRLKPPSLEPQALGPNPDSLFISSRLGPCWCVALSLFATARVHMIIFRSQSTALGSRKSILIIPE